MGLTAWERERKAKHEAWREIDELRRQNAALVAERDELAALLDKIKFIIPEMLRAAQLRSELGAYACSELSGAYSLISEIYTVMVGEFMKQTTPQQCLREIQAEAGRAGFVAGAECCADYLDTYYADIDFSKHAEQYAERVKDGQA